MTYEFSSIIAEELNLPRKSVKATIKLLDDGATIPFISRYRKEATGALDEVVIHLIQQRYEYHTALAKRKETILETIKNQEKLTSTCPTGRNAGHGRRWQLKRGWNRLPK